MKKEFAKNEREYISRYQKKGYTSSYRITGDKLTDTSSKVSYNAGEIYIVAQHRFEGMSNPSDMSILYVIETKDGSKGTVLLGYGPTADTELTDFFNKIPKKNNHYRTNLL